MFIEFFVYKVKRLLHAKEGLFWTLAFPIILGTLFFSTFGNFMEKNEIQEVIPVAVVEGENSETMKVILDNLSEGEEPLLKITYTTKEKADKLLEEEDVSSIIMASEEPSLVVKKSGIHQSIVKEVLDKYKVVQSVVADLIMQGKAKDSEQISQIASDIAEGAQVTKEISNNEGSQDSMLMYFFALIAMTCIYGSLWGVELVNQLEGNISALGARRMCAPVNKWLVLLADAVGAFFVHFIEVCIVLLYLTQILGVDFGDQTLLILPVAALGSMTGICMGMFIGAAFKCSQSVKEGLIIGISMLFCFFDGLMMHQMPYLVEKSFPLFNRINPCKLLTDCFYSLNIYGSKEIYFNYLGRMGIMALLLLTASYIVLRRKNYASI